MKGGKSYLNWREEGYIYFVIQKLEKDGYLLLKSSLLWRIIKEVEKALRCLRQKSSKRICADMMKAKIMTSL